MKTEFLPTIAAIAGSFGFAAAAAAQPSQSQTGMGGMSMPGMNMPAQADDSSMASTMRRCAKMKDDMAHDRPMSDADQKLMKSCAAMDRQMGSAPAPNTTLDR